MPWLLHARAASTMVCNMTALVSWLLGALFFLPLCFYVVRTWVRWFRSGIKLVEPKWRSTIALTGFAASTLSLAMIIGLIVYEGVGTWLPPDHPMIMLTLRTIFVSALYGIVAALAGTGPLGFPTAVCSVFCILCFLLQAIAR